MTQQKNRGLAPCRHLPNKINGNNRRKAVVFLWGFHSVDIMFLQQLMFF